jgi:hypothetical protein
VLYEYERVPAARQLLSQPEALQALQQQLSDCISCLQDDDVADLDALLHGQQQQQQQDMSAAAEYAHWRDMVELRPVTKGHRAYDPAAAAAAGVQQQHAAAQLQAVYARTTFKPGQLLGMYMGYVFDSDETRKRHMFQSPADLDYYRYQYSFAVAPPKGAERQPVQPGSSSSSSSSDNQSGCQQQQQTRRFLIDATCCLEGNPLAHMLDYRAFARDSSSGRLALPLTEQHSSSIAGGPNALLLPLSDNSSGKVYCAVVALRGIAAGEEVCIDYGADYWEVSGLLFNFKTTFG